MPEAAFSSLLAAALRPAGELIVPVTRDHRQAVAAAALGMPVE